MRELAKSYGIKLTYTKFGKTYYKTDKQLLRSLNKFGFGAGECRTSKDYNYGAGGWVLHCSACQMQTARATADGHPEGEWLPHVTLRYKPLAEHPAEYAYHYGYKPSMPGGVVHWGTRRDSTGRPVAIPAILPEHAALMRTFYGDKCISPGFAPVYAVGTPYPEGAGFSGQMYVLEGNTQNAADAAVRRLEAARVLQEKVSDAHEAAMAALGM